MTFPNYRWNSEGDIVAWAQQRMTRGIRALEDHAEEIAELGKEAVQSQIEAFGRIADPHQERDGEVSMYDGVQTSVNKSRTEGELSIRVGWDLTQFRHGYPELQDKGFTDRSGTEVIGMQALSYGRMAMREAAIKVIQEGK